MEWISSGFSAFGDYKSSLFRANDGRYCVRIYPINRKRSDKERARCEWIPRADIDAWIECHKARPA